MRTDEEIQQEYEQTNTSPSMNTRSIKEIERRIKRKSRRPPQSPCKDTVNRGSENWFGEEAETTENIRTEEQAERNADRDRTENVPNEQEAVDKMKKVKFCRKRFNTKNDEEPKKKRHIYKRKTNVDEEAKNLTEIHKKAVIRNSPRLFSEMVFYLTDEQKTWVISSGFEALLKFDLEMIPSKLSSKIVQAFDHTSVSIAIENGRIYINEEDVFSVIGLPHGGKPIELKDTEVTSRRGQEWLAQFPDKQITVARVIERVRAEPKVTEMFKINFLIVLSNVLIGTPTHSYVDKQLVKFEDLDRCVSYNWAKFLIEYLVIGKESWNRKASEFFRGSQIFLTLFYVDRVMHKGITFVDRKYPSFGGWTEEKLKERQAIEVLTGEFGKGKILVPLKEYFSQDSQSQKSTSPNKNTNDEDFYGKEHAANEWNDWPQNNNFDNDDLHGREHEWTDCQQNNLENDYDDWCQHTEETDIGNDGGQWDQHIQTNDDDQWRKWPNIQKDDNSNVEQHGADADYDQRFAENEYIDNDNVEDTNYEEDSEKDPVDVLRLRATEIINAKIQFEIDLEEAMKREPDNVELLLIQDVINEVFYAKNGSKNGNGNSNVQVQQDIRDPEHQNMPDPVDDFELDPTVLEQLEIIEYLNSEQGIKDMNEMLPVQRRSSDLFVPSFSLGPEIEIISEICKDINNEHEAVVEDDGFVTPKPLVRGKSTRHIKLGQYAKSPYIERVIDINGKYIPEDIMMWRYMALQNRDNMEEVFAWKGVKCIREHIQTMKNCTKLYYSVIDTWSTILNDKENYKADESPMRLFCTIGGLKWSLDPQKKVADTYEIFFSNMNDMISKYPSKELKDMDMVFFPIHAHEHFYLICYNLKNLAYEVIDNVKHGEDAKIFYGRIPTILHSHFCKYLQWNGFENLSKTVRKLKPTFLRMPWQTQGNSLDCGIFLMRHMETYKGDVRNWETNFRNEGCGQFKQLLKLRAKYNNAIMSSDINEKKDEIVNEAKLLFKEDAQETLLKVGCTKVRSSETRNKEEGKYAKKKKNVTFAANLTNRLEQAK
ncbi:hypothetical protein POM88_024954 [Heracleum sosnowskyi]|uniref:Ubiquitin-like protease family profile domain-containing protein n=1 Tax=Heracleum sosnowskyi TaxID=360622 RepID=A0AAD8MJC4_9APIA|nr:hypothetical protein POM88_024954 [Heracleum sosnowskyi]